MLSFDPPWALRDPFPERCGPECLLFPAWRWGSWPGPRCAGCCSELVIRAGRDWVTGRVSSSTRAGSGSWCTQNWAQGRLKKARPHELAGSLPKGRPSSGGPPGQALGLVGVPLVAVANPFLALGRGQELLKV